MALRTLGFMAAAFLALGLAPGASAVQDLDIGYCDAQYDVNCSYTASAGRAQPCALWMGGESGKRFLK